jgi:hypothetical protein
MMKGEWFTKLNIFNHCGAVIILYMCSTSLSILPLITLTLLLTFEGINTLYAAFT